MTGQIGVSRAYRPAKVENLLARARGFICPLEPILQCIPRSARHLDIGCGRGFLLAAAMKERGTRSVGCELSPIAVAAASRLAQRVATETGGPTAVILHASTFDQWPAGAFEVVTIIDVLHHIPVASQRKFLIEAARRVQPGGWLIFKDMALYPTWKRLMNTLHDLVAARQLVHYMPLDQVTALFQHQGLEMIETKRYEVLWYAHELASLRRPA